MKQYGFALMLFTAILAVVSSVVAQPNDRQIWLERVHGYARYWAGSPGNKIYCPEYERYWPPSGDCANFVSQIIQAGCGGLCEVNSLNPNDEINDGSEWDPIKSLPIAPITQ